MSSAPPAGGLEEDLNAFREEASAHPLPLVDVRLQGGVITGRVLTAGQRHRLEGLARTHGVAVDVVLVADPAHRLEEGWVDITADLVELWRDPGSIGEEQARQTQYVPGDGPLRVLGRHDGAVLAEGPDWSIGWTPPEALTPVDADSGRESWASRPRSQPGSAVLPDPGRLGGGGGGDEVLRSLLAEARADLGVPYLWGGTTAAGFDCSGLVQRVFATATGVLLPKHSGDQRRQGLRVVGENARAGDLLFATPRDRRVGHVLVMTSPTTVLHACRSQLMVIEESLGENAARYRHQGFRRPVLLHP